MSDPVPIRAWVHLIIDIVILASLFFVTLIVIPDLQERSRELQHNSANLQSLQRAEDERVRTMLEVRKRQEVLEAQILLEQERNLRLAKEIGKLLERNP